MKTPAGGRHHLVAVVVALSLSTVPAGTRPPRAGDVTLKPLSLLTSAGETIACELGTLHVPENRQDPASRVIPVAFVRVKAIAPTGAPPTIHLPGGPGNSYVRALNAHRADEAARVAPAAYVDDIALYRQHSDVIFLDQRGFSEAAGHVLTYEHRTKAYPPDEPGTLARDTAEFVEGARAAVAAFGAKGVDLRGYTVHECAADVNDLRRALGYDKVVLVGQSFGGQWTFATMRLFPEIVARAVISGVEPLDLSYDMPSHVYAAMRRMWQTAERDPRFAPYLPEGGIDAALRAVVARLERGPIKATLKDPEGGADVTMTLGRDDFEPDPADPAAILALYHGSYEAWARRVLVRRRPRTMSVPIIGPLIDTALAVTPARRQLLRTDPAIALLGAWNFDAYMATEAIWPTADAGDAFRTEVPQTIPVLFVQGTWDTSTPMENLVQVLPHFVNSRTILVDQGEHGAFARVRRTLPAATAAILEFVRSGRTAGLPTSVTVAAREFPAPDFPVPPATRTR